MARNNPKIMITPELPIDKKYTFLFRGRVIRALRVNGLCSEAVEFTRQVGQTKHLDQVIEAAEKFVCIEVMP